MGYWGVLQAICLTVSFHTVRTDAEKICNAAQQNVQSVTLETSSFSDWSTDGQCQCDITFSDQVRRLDLNLFVESFNTNSKQDKDSCSPLLIFYLHEHMFFHCPRNKSFTSRLVLTHRSADAALRFRLYNPDGKKVKAKMSLNSNAVGSEMFTIACQSHDFSLDMEACPCVDELPGPIGLIPGHQSTPTSKRLLVGFMCALAFLICGGIFLLILCLVKRGHIKPVGPLKYLVNTKDLKDPYDSAKEKEPVVASNLGFVGDSQDSINKLPKTPVSNSIANLYATVDLSSELTELPFTPDPNLRLNLKNDAGPRYRGSLDSGLYSEISSERTDKQPRGTSNGYPVIGATSMETLQALGPGHKFVPPAGQSSPKPPVRLEKDVPIEAIYAKPDKSKKAKYRNSANEERNSLTSPAGVKPSMENQPGNTSNRTQPSPFKSGSMSSLYSGQGLNISGSNTGSISMLPDATYAVPDKSKKKKKKRKAKGKLTSDSEQSLDGTGLKISIENLQEYHPKPLQKRSGSTSSVNDRASLSGSVTMIPNAIYEGRYPVSSTELHMSDAGHSSHGSHLSMETDV